MALTRNISRKTAAKAALLALLLAASLWLYHVEGLKEWLAPDQLGGRLKALGPWADGIFVLAEAVGITFFVPAALFVVMGGALFGPLRGFALAWTGAQLGASGAFFLGRVLGRDFVLHLMGERLKRYDRSITRKGLTTVLMLRLLYLPFTPMNYALSLTGVRYPHFAIGTALGSLVTIFVFSYSSGLLWHALLEGRWGVLASPAFIVVTLVFVLSIGIPRVLGKIKRKGERSGS